VTVWARLGEMDVSRINSNLFEIEWPPHSGRRQQFPELDRAQWFPLPQARERVIAAQIQFLDRLRDALAPSAMASDLVTRPGGRT
jgi:predicted NUDIX family NTP pyrophosphohydrolase